MPTDLTRLADLDAPAPETFDAAALFTAFAVTFNEAYEGYMERRATFMAAVSEALVTASDLTAKNRA